MVALWYEYCSPLQDISPAQGLQDTGSKENGLEVRTPCHSRPQSRACFLLQVSSLTAQEKSGKGRPCSNHVDVLGVRVEWVGHRVLAGLLQVSCVWG